MKRIMILLAILILLLPLPAHAGPAAKRMLSVMGGVPMATESFESSDEGYTLVNGARSTVLAHTGAYSVRFAGAGTGSMTKTYTVTNPGTWTFWYNTNESSNVTATVAHSGGTTNFSGSSGTGVWLQWTATNIPAGDVTVTINYTGFTNSVTYVDDVMHPL